MDISKSHIKNTDQNIVKTRWCINLPSKSLYPKLRNAFTILQMVDLLQIFTIFVKMCK